MKPLKTGVMLLLLLAVLNLFADERTEGSRQGREGPRGGGGKRGGGEGARPLAESAPVDDVRYVFKTEVPAHDFDVVLGRPTNHSVTASVLSYADREGVLEFGEKAGGALQKTPAFVLKAGEPFELPITGLQPDTDYVYQMSTRLAGGGWEVGDRNGFRTQRAPGKSFCFTIQADPHLDYNTEPALYLRCLFNVRADQPDFHIDLGDTFMTDKHRGRETAAAQYLAQRFYFGKITPRVPLFLVLGNHDGESGRWLDGTSGNLAVWSNGLRKKYYPNPLPDGFYTGNKTPDPRAGLLQNYYAFEWGDALFVVLDPFWYTRRKNGGGEDNWSRTLGREQYDWLTETLAGSRAKYRFVFLHHLVGGYGREARGGVIAAPLYEWGGHSPEGVDEFNRRRSGWELPIHQLLVKHKVNVVFHGHDHLYVREELDGIVYQEVPQPGYGRYDNTRSAAEYGYTAGVVEGSSGHLRVSVHPQEVTVEYVRAYLPADENGSRKNGAVSASYRLKAK